MNLAQLFHHEIDLKVLPAGEVLFCAGERSDVMYVLMSGSAEIRVHDRVMEVAEEGAMLGEMALIDDAPHSATVIAKSECSLFAIDSKRFNFMIQQTPGFALYVMRVIAARLRKTDASL